MKKLLKTCAALLLISAVCCSKPVPPPVQETPEEGFKAEIPDTVIFTNAEFIYNGDDIGEAVSDGWFIKMYTDMDIDEAGAPIGPGCVLQVLLNARYNENQSADPSLLKGRYKEMMNSMNFAPLTFVSGYMTSIALPGGEKLELADATYYADLAEGSTDMDYDLLDEGSLTIDSNANGTFTIAGILVGKKFTKRYFTWTGTIEPRNNVPEEIPNSTLRTDLTGLSFAKGQLQDKGDYFYLKDESYRCLLLFLVDETVDISLNRPAGTGFVLRLEVLVPWDTDIKNGIPAGTYEMIPRNEDTSMDRTDIVPGGAIAGLPNVFEAWKLSGCWFYELKDGAWTDTYARINDGTIRVERGDDGSHTVAYDLLDCQKLPKKISGSTSLTTIETYR